MALNVSASEPISSPDVTTVRWVRSPCAISLRALRQVEHRPDDEPRRDVRERDGDGQREERDDELRDRASPRRAPAPALIDEEAEVALRRAGSSVERHDEEMQRLAVAPARLARSLRQRHRRLRRAEAASVFPSVVMKSA